MHKVLVQDCSAEHMDIEECASCLYHDFGQIVMPIMGGPAAMVDIGAKFHKSKIRLLGTCDKILMNVLLYTQQKANAEDRRLLVKLASALARGINLKPTE